MGSNLASESTEGLHVARGPGGDGGRRPHFPRFEGLRAVAALMVVVHHAASLNGFDRASFIAVPAAVMDGGVAVFFVLSGFLIYRPFADAHRQGIPSQNVVGFWWRRLIRLLPAYWFALTALWLAGAFSLGSDWWRYYLFLQPYRPYTAVSGLVQAWSLATEVSFYLFVPFWAALVRRVIGSTRGATRVDLLGCLVLYGTGFAARAAISVADPSWRGLSFQWLPTNIDLFAVGMALAVVSVRAADGGPLGATIVRWVRGSDPWWAAGILLFGWYAARIGAPGAIQLGDANGAYRGWFWQRRQFVFGLFTALLLVPAVLGDHDRGLAHRLLRLRPVAWIGTVSYGLYLWHFDWMKRSIPRIDAFTGEQAWAGWRSLPIGTAGFWYLLAAGTGMGLLSAAFSWTMIEQPFQRLRRWTSPRIPGPGGTRTWRALRRWRAS